MTSIKYEYSQIFDHRALDSLRILFPADSPGQRLCECGDYVWTGAPVFACQTWSLRELSFYLGFSKEWGSESIPLTGWQPSCRSRWVWLPFRNAQLPSFTLLHAPSCHRHECCSQACDEHCSIKKMPPTLLTPEAVQRGCSPCQSGICSKAFYLIGRRGRRSSNLHGNSECHIWPFCSISNIPCASTIKSHEAALDGDITFSFDANGVSRL